MNQAAEQLTGWKREEALGRPLDEVANMLKEAARTARSGSPAVNGRTTLLPRKGKQM
jgi:PAS domain-containing protein